MLVFQNDTFQEDELENGVDDVEGFSDEISGGDAVTALADAAHLDGKRRSFSIHKSTALDN